MIISKSHLNKSLVYFVAINIVKLELTMQTIKAIFKGFNFSSRISFTQGGDANGN